MGYNSKIEWTTHTMNPWIGCAKVSEGCQFCYAEQMMDKQYKRVKWGPRGTRSRTSVANWKKPIAWNKEAKAHGVRHRVFCASLADVFEDRAELEPWREELFKLIDATPCLDWLLLTKRPENIRRMWPGGYRQNVWRGTSVENQMRAYQRIPIIADTNDLSPVAFLSCEPLLERITLKVVLSKHRTHWIICGGESGPNKRHFDCDWGRDLRDECAELNLPYFFKQVDKIRPVPQDLMIRQFPNPKGGITKPQVSTPA